MSQDVQGLEIKMLCKKCGKKIPKARLQALPDTTTCVKCSEVQAKMGVTIWDGTTSVVEIVDGTEAEEFQRYERGDGRLGRLK